LVQSESWHGCRRRLLLLFLVLIQKLWFDQIKIFAQLLRRTAELWRLGLIVLPTFGFLACWSLSSVLALVFVAVNV
jgi:hypothetical protein